MSSRDLKDFQVAFRVKVEDLLKACKSAKLRVKLTDGLRSFAEQDELYAQGRTKPGKVVTMAKGGQSIHQFGLAADFCFLTSKGEATWDGDWRLFGKMVRGVGLEWGGDWKRFVDRPHVQMPGWTWRRAMLKWPEGWKARV
mgnify:FL=1